MTLSKRLNHIDCTRGFAIICVIIGHVLGKTVEAEGFDTFSIYNVIFKFIYSFHMPLFFFLSGIFVNSHLKKSFSEGIKKKFLRLMIPYFVWTFIFVLIKQLSPSLQSNETSWSVFLKSPIDPNPLQYWFLYVLFVVYVIYSISFWLIKENKKTNIIILIISLVLALINPLVENVWISHYLFQNLIFLR